MDPKLIPPEFQNLLDTPVWSSKKARDLGNEVCESYKIDKDQNAGWFTKQKEWLALYHQRHEISSPVEGGSTENMPILTEACNQFAARAYGSIFTNRRIIRVVPGGKGGLFDTQRAKRVEDHMTWQLLDKMKGYKADKDALFLGVAIRGSMFTKTYYDWSKGIPVVENVRPSELILPYTKGRVSMADLPRKTHVLTIPFWKCKRLHAQGFFSSLPVPATDLTEEYTDVDHLMDKEIGVEPSSQNQTTDYCVILEQHRFIEEKGGIMIPVIVWVDWVTKKPLRITIRYEVDELGQPLDDFQPIEYFSHYYFLPNVDGIYGLGYGSIIGQLNIAVNRLLRLALDGMILSTVGRMSGFVSNRLTPGLIGEGVKLEVGRFIRTAASPEDIEKGLKTLELQEPSPLCASLLEMLNAKADRLGMVTESTTGQISKVLQPNTVLALLEQSQQVYSSIHERLVESWKEELEKVYRLNGKYLSVTQYMHAVDLTGSPQIVTVAGTDYAPDDFVIPLIDGRMAIAKERMAANDVEWQTMQPFIPMLQMIAPQIVFNLIRRRLEAYRVNNLEEILPPPELLGLTAPPPGTQGESNSNSGGSTPEQKDNSNPQGTSGQSRSLNSPNPAKKEE
jgi:hypothetical protein